MTYAETIESLRSCFGFGTCSECKAKSMMEEDPLPCKLDCKDRLGLYAADLIERLEKERNALIEAANSRKLCEICKNDSYCFDARCTENTCDDCYQYRVCPCSNCLSHPKFEWKGLENVL